MRGRSLVRFASWPWLVLALVVTWVAATAILALGDRADESRQVQTLLVRLGSYGSRISAIEWQAVAEQNLTLDLVSRLDETRREMNSTFRALLARGLDPAMVGDLEESFHAYSRAVVEKFRLLDRGDLAQMRRLELARVAPAYERFVQSLADANAHYDRTVTHTRRWVRLSIMGLFAATVVVMGLMIFVLERARGRAKLELVRVEQAALRHSEERFRSLVENASDLILIVDGQGRIAYASDSAATLIGFSAPMLLGTPLVELFHEDDMSAVERLLNQPARDGARGELTQVRFKTQVGAWRSGEIVCVNRLGDPAIGGIVVTVYDVTETREAALALEQQANELKRSNDDLQQFAYVASHDLQEPLRMVIGYMGLLNKRYAGKLGPEAHEFIRFAVDGAKRMQALIDDLLVYSRTGTQAKEVQEVDSCAVLGKTLETLNIAILESNARVTHDKLPLVKVEGTQLGQLFQNLIGNALKYRNGKAPEIFIGCRRAGNFWEFFVRDNGIGIDPQFAQKIFIIFQRLHSREAYPGTGIGLALCKKIVERHGGRIWVESTPQEGSTFYFTLPAAPASPRDLSAVARADVTAQIGTTANQERSGRSATFNDDGTHKEMV